MMSFHSFEPEAMCVRVCVCLGFLRNRLLHFFKLLLILYYRIAEHIWRKVLTDLIHILLVPLELIELTLAESMASFALVDSLS